MEDSITFDPHGDLTLRVGEEQREYIVCPKTVARASPVFRTMLYGNFRESRPADPNVSWVVDLPADDPWVIEIIFYIIHSLFDCVPTSLTLRAIYNILVVTQKYDMTQLVRPWAGTWFLPYRQTDRWSPKLICVAWELGDVEMVMRVAKALCVECGMNGDDQLVNSDGDIFDLSICLEPLGLVDNILRTRQELLDAIFNMLNDLITRLRRAVGAGDYCNVSRSGKDAHHCSATILGSLLSFLGDNELQAVWRKDGDPPVSYPLSINKLVRAIESIETLTSSYAHERCDPIPNLTRKIKERVESRDSPVTAEHMEHLRKQALKSGFTVPIPP